MIGVVALNLGGPDGPDAVEPFLRNLFADPDVIQLGWLSFMQPLFAKLIAKRRAPESREAYDQIGGRSPIREETTAQAEAVVEVLKERGIDAKAYVSMACWHPFAYEAVDAMKADGVTKAIALPLFPHFSYTTTGSAFKLLDKAVGDSGIEVEQVERYPDAPGFVEAICDRISEAIATLPEEHRETAPILFSAHGLPESYIQKGDPYLDEIRMTVAAVQRRMQLGDRTRLCFQSRIGRQKWLSPYTEQMLDELAEDGTEAVVVVPVAFTGEHIETLQELDILYRERAEKNGIKHFARAATVGVHPSFVRTLADLTAVAAASRGWT